MNGTKITTQKGETYEVLDMSLANQGKLNIELAELNMAALLMIRERFIKEQPLKGVRVGLALHVTKETAVLCRTLVAGGAQVAITGCNPLSTQDDVAAALAAEGIRVYAYKGETNEDYYRYLREIIKFKPHVTIDDGCDLISVLHQEFEDQLPEVYGACEETTTGIIRLKAMVRDKALKFPVIAVNDNKTKHLLDNYYGTGQSTLDGIIRATSTFIAGKNFVIAGYGPCGKGIAMRAKGLGAKVIVCEVDNFRALQAAYDGFQVMTMKKAAPIADIIVTVTGCKDIITVAHMKSMKKGTIICNAGHFDCEIQVAQAAEAVKAAGNEIISTRPFMQKYDFGSNFIFILGGGRLINLAAGEGHPSEVMSTSFCGQALAVEYIAKNAKTLQRENNLIQLPDEIDDRIAGLQLQAMGIEKDELTPEQSKYINSWTEGT